MVEEMLKRWNDMGKPLFILPKDFREKILISMEQELKISLLKWLTQGLEIDSFEIFSILIIYSNGTQDDKLQLLFDLYCYSDEVFQTKDEFQYMIDKLITTLSGLLCFKRSFIADQS
jgi:hypothetical protein